MARSVRSVLKTRSLFYRKESGAKRPAARSFILSPEKCT
jgi:hypothetical protein